MKGNVFLAALPSGSKERKVKTSTLTTPKKPTKTDPPEWLNDIGKGLAQLGSDIKEGVSDAVDATSGFISNAANSVVAALKEGDKAMDGGSGSTNTSKNFIGDDSSVREGTIEGETEVDQFILMPTPTNSPTKAIEAGAGLYEAFSNAMTIVESSKEIVGNKDPTQTPNPRDTVKTESGRYFIFKSGMQNGYLAKEPQNKNVPKVPRNGN